MSEAQPIGEHPEQARPLVVTDNLTKHFTLRGGHRLHAVDGVSLTIHEREIVGLVGESGSGKSTYGKTLIGLHGKTAGTVSYRGRAAAATTTSRRTSSAGRRRCR